LNPVPTFEYATDIAQLPTEPQCPPGDAKQEERLCFRFSFDPLTASSFIPAGKIKPQRMHGASDAIACSMLALSMYSSESKARAKYASVIKTNPNAPKTLGTHLARGKVLAGDGVCTPVTGSGHFDFHPYIGINLVSSFVLVGPLP